MISAETIVGAVAVVVVWFGVKLARKAWARRRLRREIDRCEREYAARQGPRA